MPVFVSRGQPYPSMSLAHSMTTSLGEPLSRTPMHNISKTNQQRQSAAATVFNHVALPLDISKG